MNNNTEEVLYRQSVIRRAIKELGTQYFFCALMHRHGYSTCRATICKWIDDGVIPRRYRSGIAAIVKEYRGVLSQPDELLKCVSDGKARYTPKATYNSNRVLNETIGSIPKFLEQSNKGIPEQDHYTYQKVHGWLKMGYIPDEYYEELGNGRFPEECFRPGAKERFKAAEYERYMEEERKRKKLALKKAAEELIG